MLTELRLENFRGFESHAIPLHHRTIIVGPNNAGKSTIAEALRLVSLIVNRGPHAVFANVPSWLDHREAFRGISPSMRGLEINLRTAFHRYAPPPAVITALFERGPSVTVFVGGNGIHGVFRDALGRPLTTKGLVAEAFGRVSINPQVGPVARDERVLDPGYIRRAASSALAPLHFRNQLYYFSDAVSAFKDAAEDTWPGLKVGALEVETVDGNRILRLEIRDRDFVGELATMGHGLQVWLQTMWFLARSSRDDTVILDEPDVYLHADVQRRLIRHLRKLESQIIVATHSPEIIGDVDPDDVLLVDRREERSAFAGTLPAVQEVLYQLGSPHNLQLARLWDSTAALLVEGDDAEFLNFFHAQIHPHGPPLTNLSIFPLGGWGGWDFRVRDPLRLKNARGERIRIYALFDRDYHTPAQISARLDDGRAKGIEVWVWGRKEIENYLLVDAAIARLIERRHKKGRLPSAAEIGAKIDEISKGLEEDALKGFVSEYGKAAPRGQDPATSYEEARAHFSSVWHGEGARSVVSGKEVLRRLSAWSAKAYGVGFTPPTIAREIRAEEIPVELSKVLTRIHRRQSLAGVGARR